MVRVIAIAVALLFGTIACEARSDPPPDLLWQAIMEVESKGNPYAYNSAEEAAGVAQIRPILVADVNRILGAETYTLKDRWDADKSHEMFGLYLAHYTGPDATAETMARVWNGGPTGATKESTLVYWGKVKAVMDRISPPQAVSPEIPEEAPVASSGDQPPDGAPEPLEPVTEPVSQPEGQEPPPWWVGVGLFVVVGVVVADGIAGRGC